MKDVRHDLLDSLFDVITHGLRPVFLLPGSQGYDNRRNHVGHSIPPASSSIRHDVAPESSSLSLANPCRSNTSRAGAFFWDGMTPAVTALSPRRRPSSQICASMAVSTVRPITRQLSKNVSTSRLSPFSLAMMMPTIPLSPNLSLTPIVAVVHSGSIIRWAISPSEYRRVVTLNWLVFCVSCAARTMLT